MNDHTEGAALGQAVQVHMQLDDELPELPEDPEDPEDPADLDEELDVQLQFSDPIGLIVRLEGTDPVQLLEIIVSKVLGPVQLNAVLMP